MSKSVTSPVKKWPGKVILADPITFPQLYAFEDSVDQIQNNREISRDRADGIWIPGILACAEKWDLENFPKEPTVENFPASPRIASSKLIAWLVAEITKIYQEAEELPNA